MEGNDSQAGRSRLRLPVSVKPRHFLFLANFIVAKGIVYVMPLVLAAIAGTEFYGGIELALSIGLQACAILLGAPLAGITQVYLIKRDPAVGDLLLFLTFTSTLALLLLTCILWLAGTGTFAVLTASVVSVTVIQNVGSTWFRMRGERNRTAWADSASILLAGFVAIGVVVVFGSGGTGIAAAIFALLTGLMALLSGMALLRHRVPELRARLARASRIGLPMVVTGVFAIWLGVGGRILVGITSPADLAPYSLAFRIAGLAFGVHQLATTAAFPLLYATRTRRADRLLAMFMAAVLVTAAGLALAGPFVVDLFKFSSFSEHDKATFKALVPLTSFQTFFWIGFGLLQFRINRSGIAKASILPILLVTAAGIAIILLVAHFLSNDVRLISLFVAVHSVAYYAMAWWVLARRRLPFRYMGLIGLAGAVLLGSIALLTV